MTDIPFFIRKLEEIATQEARYTTSVGHSMLTLEEVRQANWAYRAARLIEQQADKLNELQTLEALKRAARPDDGPKP